MVQLKVSHNVTALTSTSTKKICRPKAGSESSPIDADWTQEQLLQLDAAVRASSKRSPGQPIDWDATKVKGRTAIQCMAKWAQEAVKEELPKPTTCSTWTRRDGESTFRT